ncbi:hypothetical protein C1I97_18600 [Streptomyces sp. NTH33]|uniref:hypothetical protein n=1 Tax=Streptomyces sp. NTH33 TaxID=1735453 RepID=UPI000DA7370B|nr:hypothetical protein C1I97_18600 [Streptomyces sp. NTH33]
MPVGALAAGPHRTGDRPHKENELAAGPGLSRHSPREALGFAVAFHRGDTVPKFPAVRRVLEPAAAAMAATRIGEQQPDALGRTLREHRAVLGALRSPARR